MSKVESGFNREIGKETPRVIEPQGLVWRRLQAFGLWRRKFPSIKAFGSY